MHEAAPPGGGSWDPGEGFVGGRSDSLTVHGTSPTMILLCVACLCAGCGEEVVYVYSPPSAERAHRWSGRVPPVEGLRVVQHVERPEAPPRRAAPPAGPAPSASAPGAPGPSPVPELPPSPAEETVVATVNGQPITWGELVEELMVRHGKAVFEDLIRTRAVEQEVARAGVGVGEEEIENELARERVGFRMSRGEYKTFEEMIRKRWGMSMEGYRGIVRRGLLIRKMILRRESTTEDEIMLWFYQNRERYDVPAQITVSHIVIAKDEPETGTPRAGDWVRARVEKVRRGLIRDKDFGELARLYSDDAASRGKGGELGTVNERAARAHLDPAFFEVMMTLKPGQAGGPVETTKGHHFIKVTALKEGRKVEYRQVRAQVRVDYMEERAALLGEVFLRGLMERTKIERMYEPPKGGTDTTEARRHGERREGSGSR